MRRWRVTVLVVCALLPASGNAVGQATEAVLGEVTPEVVSLSDPTQRYALYVPTAYRPDRAWPVVLAMDPRGRALIPMTALRDVAERLGYIVISSYNTVSDGPVEPNEVAVIAMIDDVQRLFSVDTRRLYFVGFSGTARISWNFGNNLSENTAGVIGFGAGLPSTRWLMARTLDDGPPFAFYGGTGKLDFNYEEVIELDWTLDSEDFAHVFEFYEGPHAWPPPAVFERALEWMEVQAVRSGLRDPDEVLLDGLLQRRMDRAGALEAEGAVYAAAGNYRDITTDFAGLRDVEAARDRAGELSESRAFRDTEAALRSAIEERQQFENRVGDVLRSVWRTLRPFDVDDTVRRLDVDKLKERASGNTDDEDAQVARRMLESLFLRASFYEPRSYIEAEEFEIAVALYRLADVIRPRSPRVCLGLARAYAQLDESDRAFEALECVVETGAVSDAVLEFDVLLTPLHPDPRFADLLSRKRPE